MSVRPFRRFLHSTRQELRARQSTSFGRRRRSGSSPVLSTALKRARLQEGDRERPARPRAVQRRFHSSRSSVWPDRPVTTACGSMTSESRRREAARRALSARSTHQTAGRRPGRRRAPGWLARVLPLPRAVSIAGSLRRHWLEVVGQAPLRLTKNVDNGAAVGERQAAVARLLLAAR